MKRSFILFSLIIIALVSFSCSAAFKATVNGKVVDALLYENDPNGGAISNVRVYLYLTEKDRSADIADWESTGLRPDEAKFDKKNKAIKQRYSGSVSLTDNGGNFQIADIWWMDYFPEFGSDASVATGFFLFFHDDYGLIAAKNPIKLIGGGGTITVPPFAIDKAINETLVKGRIVDPNLVESNMSVGVAGAIVKIYMPRKWSVDTSGNVTVANSDWKTEPSYTLTTDAQGYYSQMVSYRKYAPGSSDSVDKILIRITYQKDDYAPFCLKTDVNSAFCGYMPDGAKYNGTAEIDLRDTNNWVLLDGAQTQVEFYNHQKKAKSTVMVGKSGSEITKADFDLDADGYKDNYYQLKIESKGDKRENIITLPDFSLRKIKMMAKVSGRVFDSAKAGVDNCQITFSWFNSENSLIGTTTTQSVVFGSDGTNKEEGHYNYTLTLTEYNYDSLNVVQKPISIVSEKVGVGKKSEDAVALTFGIATVYENEHSITLDVATP